MTTHNLARRSITTVPVESISQLQRHGLLLQAWESINSERELEGVLAAVAKVLVPVVPFLAVAIIAPEARQGAPWAMHVVDVEKRECESVDDFAVRMRTMYPAHQSLPEKKMIPYAGSELE